MGYVDIRERRREDDLARSESGAENLWHEARDSPYLSLAIGSVLVMVALLTAQSAQAGLDLFLLSVTPSVPAAILLSRGIQQLLSRDTRVAAPEKLGAEKQLLLALRASGGLTAVEAALETSLTVDEADAILSRLVERGHLRVEGRDGVLCYSLPGGHTTDVPGPLRESGDRTS